MASLSAIPQLPGLSASEMVRTRLFPSGDNLPYMVANQSETGGLSGAPLKAYSLAALRTLRGQLPGRILLIGCGGISTGSDALEYAKAGASLVQLYTRFGYDGMGACRRIKDQIVEELEKEGTTWDEVVRKAVRELSLKEDAS